MTKVTYAQIVQFRNNSRQYLGSKKVEQSKLHYALTKLIKKTESHFNDFTEQEQEIRIELAKTDKDGTLVLDKENNYTYTKEEAKKLHKKLRELRDTQVEIEPHIVTDLPKDLEPIWYEFFVPFVIEDREPE